MAESREKAEPLIEDKEVPHILILRGTIGIGCWGAIDYLVNHEGYRTRDER